MKQSRVEKICPQSREEWIKITFLKSIPRGKDEACVLCGKINNLCFIEIEEGGFVFESFL